MAINNFTRNQSELQEAQRVGMYNMWLAGATGDEIAEEYECSYNNVKNIISRYRKRLEREAKAEAYANRLHKLEMALSIMCTACDPGMWPEHLRSKVLKILEDKNDLDISITTRGRILFQRRSTSLTGLQRDRNSESKK
jgi:transposase